MPRRRTVAIASALTLLALLGLAVVAVVTVTQTSAGREQVRRFVTRVLAPAVHGRLYVGRISGPLFNGVTIDSLEIRDAGDSLLVATGPISLAFDPRDLLDRRVLIRRLRVEHPVVRLQSYGDGDWNYKRIFPPGPARPPRAERGFGDFVVARDVVIHDGAFTLVQPWEPSDTLRGAARERVIAATLAGREHETRRVPGGFTRTLRWTGGMLQSSYVRLADPDSAGMFVAIDRLRVDESDPPFNFRNIRGVARVLDDSLEVRVAHFDLPGSTGRGWGRVYWGGDLPMRYALHVIGDSVSLRDVAWVYPTLPRTGGGSMVLDMRSQAENPEVIDYALSRIDVRTTGSRVRGRMTFAVGGPVLGVTDVAVQAMPVDFELIKVLNGKPFPYPWRGRITGTLRARGGPLNRFVVDEARVVFDDANVPGAISRGRARGALDILDPALTTFHGLAVDVEQFDLRTIEFLNPNFPRLGGIVAGHAVLDSMYESPYVRDADLVHRDGPGEPTRVVGSGHVDLRTAVTRYDLAVTAAPLSFTTLARSYPLLPLRGSYAGPVRLQGTIDDLQLAAELRGAAGLLAFDGRVDAYPPGYRATGTARVADLDVRTLLERPGAPATRLTGRVDLDVAGDSLADLVGRVAIATERSTVDGVRVDPSVARVTFDAGRARLDTVRIEMPAATLTARGAIGLAAGAVDSVRFRLVADSLGGLRRYLTPAVIAERDSLAGTVTVTGTAVGSVRDVAVAGQATGTGVVIGAQRVASAEATFALRDLPRAPSGTLSMVLDSIVAGGVRLVRARGDVTVRGPSAATFRVTGVSTTGPRGTVGGAIDRLSDTTVVTLDTATIALGQPDGAHRDAHQDALPSSSVWTLARRARIVVAPDALALDSLELRGSTAGRLLASGVVPTDGPIALAVRADSVALADLGALAQFPTPLAGRVTLALDVAGTRQRPTMTLAGALGGAQVGDVRLDRVSARANYADRRLDAALDLFYDGRRALAATASLPIDLTLAAVADRRLDQPLRGTIRSDSVGLDVLSTFVPSVRDPQGTFRANLDLGGTWRRPALAGALTLADASLGLEHLGSVRFTNIAADVRFDGDSIVIRQLSAESGDERGGSARLTGAIALRDAGDPHFDLRLVARDFHVIERPRVAHLDVSANVRLAGALSGSSLSGDVTVARGTVYIPELVTKQLISLDDPDLFNVVDTTLFANRSLLPSPPPALVRNLDVTSMRVDMGDDVWLRSAEANINLGGSLEVQVRRGRQRGRSADQLVLQGDLFARRGTYRLNLGPVQRTFEVEQGTLRFYGNPEVNPLLDINAVYAVRDYGGQVARQGQDVRIRVHIGGALLQPTLALSSADSLQISETDLVSYLVTGAPAAALVGGTESPTLTAARALLRSAGAYIGDYLRTVGPFDVVKIQTEYQGENGRLGSGFGSSLLAGTRLYVGWQLSDRTFINLTAGLCSLRQLFGTSGGAFSAADFGNALGFRVDQQLTRGFGFSVGLEPPSNAQFCTAGAVTARGFTPTPQQWGLDFFRAWRF